MKRLLLLSLVLASATALPQKPAPKVRPSHCATCKPSGSGVCRACKVCSSCKNCSKNGGTCSVCKPAKAKR